MPKQSQIPSRFKERYGQLVDDPDAFFGCLQTLPPKSFRVNTLKTSVDAVRTRFDGYGIEIRQMPWYDCAFVSDNLEIGSTLEHFLGNIYFQELASMLPPLALFEELRQARVVLDACAAPGSKTTQMAAMMGNQGMIVANDVDYGRIKALKFNLEKVGALNTTISNKNLLYIPTPSTPIFDVVLVDAPCSAEGTVRKNDSVFALWSEKYLQKLAKAQKQLILKGYDLLSPGGVLVYSTCTFAPEENECVVQALLQERNSAQIAEISIPGFRLSPGLSEWNGISFDASLKKTARVWPHHNNTDGFFLAKIRKGEEY